MGFRKSFPAPQQLPFPRVVNLLLFPTLDLDVFKDPGGWMEAVAGWREAPPG